MHSDGIFEFRDRISQRMVTESGWRDSFAGKVVVATDAMHDENTWFAMYN
jgi:hypothetical protein